MHCKNLRGPATPAPSHLIGAVLAQEVRSAARWNKGRAAIFTLLAVGPRLQLPEL
jgi:hypothetical protein